MSELEQIKSDYLTKLKQVKLAKAGININDVDVYVKYIDADNVEEIEQEAQAIVADIKQQNTSRDAYHDETVWKPF